jgi:hypothetical protein
VSATVLTNANVITCDAEAPWRVPAASWFVSRGMRDA